MGKHYKQKTKKNIIAQLLLLMFFILLIISLYEIVEWCINNNKNRKIKEEVSEFITIEKAEEEKQEYNVDFENLKEKNADSIAWLKVNGTEVDYPVVQTNDNNYYLKNNFNKEYNSAGWIFADYRNKFDGTDKNIIIYGHNRRDNSMFGSLRNILKEEWYNNKENYIINLITEDEKQKYEVFSVYQIETEDYYIKTAFNEGEFSNYIETVMNRSIKKFNIEVTENDNILTLSTCANNKEYRIVLHAKKII